jgi:Mg-chelatase subunit ChlD
MAGSNTVATITIASNGAYTVNLEGPIDHPVANVEDVASFDVTVRASDGTQSSTGTLKVNIEDDSPVITNTEDTDVAYDFGSSVTGDLGIAYGADGPFQGSLELTGITDNDPVMATTPSEVDPVQLTADDVPLVYTYDVNGDLIAVKDDDPSYIAFRVSLDEASGEYTFTVENGIDGGPTSTIVDLTDASNINGGNVGELFIDVFLDEDNNADAVLVATGSGSSADDTVNYNSNAMGVGQGSKIDPGDTFTLAYHEGNNTSVGELKEMAQAEVSAWHLDSDETGTWTAYLDGVEVGSGSFTGTDAKFDSFTVKPTETDGNGEIYSSFDTIEFTSADNSSEFGINEIIIYDREVFNGADQTVSFNFGLTDADLDPASGTFSVTFDADQSTPELINEPPSIVVDTGNLDGADDVVYESGLPEGSGIAPSAITAEGTFTISDPDGLDDIYSLSIAGNDPYIFDGGLELSDLVGNTFQTNHGEIEISGYADGEYSYTYTLNEVTQDIDGVTETDSFNVIVSDGAASDRATINIEIIDDTPTAVDDYASASKSTADPTNLMVMIDVSGSMSNTVTYDGQSMTRLEATKLAVTDLLNSYDNISETAVRLVQFSGEDDNNDAGDALALGTGWITVADAIDLVEGLQSGNSSGTGQWTNYDAALAVAQDAFSTADGKIDGAQNVSYFLSDGEPTIGSGGDGIDSGEESDWKDFLNTQDIVSYAIGVGTGASQGALDPVAWDGKNETELDGIVVTQESDLSEVLQTTVVTPPTSGNVLDNDTSGADGWGTPELVSVEFDSTIYAFDADNHSFSIDLGVGKGTLVIEEDGDYTFTPPAGGAYGAPVVINYTAIDGDGDQTTASLNIINPLLVVGSNADDAGSSTEDHYLPNPVLVPDVDGDIVGGASSDVLIGDLGGTTLEAGDTGNFVLVLDTSGSMSTDISFGNGSVPRIEALQLATVNTLTKLANSGAENVRVHIVEFNTNANSIGSTGGTYDLIVDGVVNTAALATAINDINDLDDGGYTNYEAGLQTAQEWIESSDPLVNADTNKLLFISDGEPNRALNDSGDVIQVSAQNAIDQILGEDDSTDEVAIIEDAGFTIEAIGINVSNTALGYLDQVEGPGGDADNITTAEQLGVLVSDLAGATTIEKAVGGDTINGGDGDDIIFGDTPNTDAMDSDGSVYGEAGTHDGAGYAVLVDHLGSDEAVLNHLSSPNTAEAYNVAGDLRGDDDTIDGGAGNDTIFGQGGDDIVLGGTGNDHLDGGTGLDLLLGDEGDDLLIGGLGGDTFVFSANGGEGTDTVLDFNASEDTLLFTDVLDGVDIDTEIGVDDLAGVVSMHVDDSTTITLEVTGSEGTTNVTLNAAEGTDFSSITDLADLPVEVTPDTYSS